MSKPQPIPQKLRAKDIATIYGIGLSTVWLYAKQNKLQATKVTSGCTVFDKAQVEAFFNGEKAEGVTA